MELPARNLLAGHYLYHNARTYVVQATHTTTLRPSLHYNRTVVVALVRDVTEYATLSEVALPPTLLRSLWNGSDESTALVFDLNERLSFG